MTWTLVPCGINGCTALHGVTRRPSRSALDTEPMGGDGPASTPVAERRPARKGATAGAVRDGGRHSRILPAVGVAPAGPVAGRGPSRPFDGPFVSPLRNHKPEAEVPPRR